MLEGWNEADASRLQRKEIGENGGQRRIAVAPHQAGQCRKPEGLGGILHHRKHLQGGAGVTFSNGLGKLRLEKWNIGEEQPKDIAQSCLAHIGEKACEALRIPDVWACGWRICTMVGICGHGVLAVRQWEAEHRYGIVR
jgi:hypothetical protein